MKFAVTQDGFELSKCLLLFLLFIKETKELSVGLEKRDLKEKKGKQGSLGSSMCAGEEPHVLVELILFTKVQGLQNGLFNFIQKHFNVYKISEKKVSEKWLTTNWKMYQAIISLRSTFCSNFSSPVRS